MSKPSCFFDLRVSIRSSRFTRSCFTRSLGRDEGFGGVTESNLECAADARPVVAMVCISEEAVGYP